MNVTLVQYLKYISQVNYTKFKNEDLNHFDRQEAGDNIKENMKYLQIIEEDYPELLV